MTTAPASVRAILPKLADQASVDWSRPLNNWSSDMMVDFISLAIDLVEDAQLAALREANSSTFTLTLRPLPNIDAIKSLRWILKNMLRRHGLRCTDLRQETL